MKKFSYLSKMNLYAKTPLHEFTDEQLVHITNICIEFCYNLLGINNKKHKQVSVCIYDYTSTDNWGNYTSGTIVGEYCPTENEIRLFKDSITNLGEFTSTFIHEYTHSVQPITTKYYKLIKEYSYKEHPFEVEAINNEKKLNRKLLNHLRKCYSL